MRPKNYVRGINETTDPRLKFHNEHLKQLITNFEQQRKDTHKGVKMSMPKVDTLNGDGIFENLDGKGRLLFEYEIKREVTEDVWIKTRKLRKLINTDIIIQAYEGTDLIRTFKPGDIDRKGEIKRVVMWQPSSQTSESVTSVRVTTYKEHRSIEDLVQYIKEVI